MKTNRRLTLICGAILSILLHIILFFRAGSGMVVDAKSNRQQSTNSLQIQLLAPHAETKRLKGEETIRSKREAPEIRAVGKTIGTPDKTSLKTQAASNLPIAPSAPQGISENEAQLRIDLEAARASAREFTAGYRTKDDAPVAQLQIKPLYESKAETRLGRNIANTARPDCKNLATNAGLLALVIIPVTIATDKKDSGCKW